MNVVYTHNGILFNHRKKRGFDTRYNVDETSRHYAKGNKRHKMTNSIWSYLDEVHTVVSLPKMESRILVTGAEEKRWGVVQCGAVFSLTR